MLSDTKGVGMAMDKGVDTAMVCSVTAGTEVWAKQKTEWLSKNQNVSRDRNVGMDVD